MTEKPRPQRRLYLAGRFVLALTASDRTTDEAERIMAEIMADEQTTVQVIGVLAHMVAEQAEELNGAEWRSRFGFAMNELELKDREE